MVRRIRLITGLVLFAYVAMHLVNHALGLISYQAMGDGRVWFLALWRNPVGTVLLYGSLLIHFGLAMWALYQRRDLRMPPVEAAQLMIGVLIPVLLAQHVIGTRGANALAGTDDSYAYVLLVHFKYGRQQLFYIQTAALLATWLHGCIGLNHWLRLKPWYPRAAPLLSATALLLPVLAWLGYVAGGRQVLALAENRAWLRAAAAEIKWPDRTTAAILERMAWEVWWTVGIALAIVLLARVFRTLAERRRGVVCITYPVGRAVSVTPGTSVLEASRANDIPHASVCGGRGRCSTCRVRITDGLDRLPPPSAEEARVLDRIGNPVQVRLACQTRPVHDLAVVPLLPPNASARDGLPRPAYLHGEEREIAILFADMRDFTRLSEQKLPYDVVFILNRYFAAMGEAVEQAGGHLDKFIGDGVMALFGIDGDIGDGARRALHAASLMAQNLDELNGSLQNDLDQPLRIGIGIHSGTAIIGEMGYARATTVTAIGDAVNTASRLEAMTKDYGAQLVVSETVARQADVDLSGFPSHEIEVRGRAGTIVVRVVSDARDLPTAGC